jgi:limonene-1,2-epoxide hydrolase
MSDSSLETVFDHLHARWRKDIEAVAARLDPEVAHQGVYTELVCNGRDEVLEQVRRSMDSEHVGVDAMEIVNAGDRVVVGLAGPRFSDRQWPQLQGQIFVVFTVRDDRIVRMDDYLTRGEALRAAGATEHGWV